MTEYNGSKTCDGCGGQVSPVEAMIGTTCPACRQAKLTALIKNRMAG